jgi:hypothetical protein
LSHLISNGGSTDPHVLLFGAGESRRAIHLCLSSDCLGDGRPPILCFYAFVPLPSPIEIVAFPQFLGRRPVGQPHRFAPLYLLHIDWSPAVVVRGRTGSICHFGGPVGAGRLDAVNGADKRCVGCRFDAFDSATSRRIAVIQRCAVEAPGGPMLTRDARHFRIRMMAVMAENATELRSFLRL